MSRRSVIVGGGYIGIEVAEALVDRGIEVTMITSGSHVLEKTLDEEMGDLGRRGGPVATGSSLHTGMRVRCIRGTERATGIGCDELEFPADLIVIGLGAGPEIDLAKAAGHPPGSLGGHRGRRVSAHARSKACGRPAIAPRSATGSAASRSTSSWVPSPTRPAGSPEPTSPQRSTAST